MQQRILVDPINAAEESNLEQVAVIQRQALFYDLAVRGVGM